VRPCDWSDALFARLNATPPNGKPVTKWENRDEAWTEVALALKLRVKEVLTLRLQATVPDVNFPIVAMPQSPFMAEQVETYMEDASAAEKLYKQIAEDAKKQKKPRNRIFADLQTKLLSIDKDTILSWLRLQKKAGKAPPGMEKYIEE
jgi:hypothetical protein